jgi:TRAP transporter 4TM/12TM fusion protein
MRGGLWGPGALGFSAAPPTAHASERVEVHVMSPPPASTDPADAPAGPARFRTLTGRARHVERVLLAALTLTGVGWGLGLHHWAGVAVFKEQYLGLFLALALAAVFVATPAHPRAPAARVPWYDWLLAAGGLLVGLYVAARYPTLAYALGVVTADKVLLGALAILLLLEATRRLFGWALVWVAVACLAYAKLAAFLPEPLTAKSAGWSRLAVYLYLDANALFGVALTVAAGVVVAFVLFGQALGAVGGDRFLSDLALVAMGRFRGGPAKVAVVSSTLFGTVSGSAVSNVVIDGAITIPMMKRAGYPPHLAAAIEAVASNGGQIMPPVMGAAAFLIAEFLGLPYGRVALAAAIPAGLYYLALFVQVDLEAAKLGLRGLGAADLPRLGAVLRRGGVFVIPLGVLVYTLMLAGWEPGQAGLAAVGATFAAGAGGLGGQAARPSLRGVLTAVVQSGRTMLDLTVVTALAGLVIGALQLSGFTSKLPLLLVGLAGEHAVGLLVLTAVVCVLLGMSLPTTVVYVTLAVLVGPGLTQLGIPPLAAHLFLFYFGMLSLITPPDCLATYAAAAIARADFWKTGWTGMRLGIVAYVVPFAFAFQPALLGLAPAGDVVVAVAAAAGGVVVLAAGSVGHLVRPLGRVKRSVLILAGLLALVCAGGPARALGAIGLAAGLILALWEWTAGGPARRAYAKPGPERPAIREIR